MSDLLASVIVGAGPAGLGPLVCAMQRGRHEELLSRGIAWIEERRSIGHGAIGEYGIGSDTAASVLLECLAGENNPLSALSTSQVAQAVRSYGSASLPLAAAGTFLGAIGDVAARVIAAHRPSELIVGERAQRIVARGPYDFVVEFGNGQSRRAHSVVMALGGRQDRDELLAREVTAGVRLRDGYADKCFMTAELFAEGGMRRLIDSLKRSPNPRVVIVGSSHSAVTAAGLLLDSGVAFADGAISLVCRRPPKVFYADVASARTDGYRDFDERDLCPTTGRVYRLAGLRMAARELMRRVLGLGGCALEKRLRVLSLNEMERAELEALLGSADAVIPAFGYRPRTLPVVDAHERPIRLRQEVTPELALVDARCRVVLADEQPMPGLFAVGLASGFVPRGEKLGGEPSFTGQTNGLWLYQNGIGAMILEGILASADHARSARGAPAASRRDVAGVPL